MTPHWPEDEAKKDTWMYNLDRQDEKTRAPPKTYGVKLILEAFMEDGQSRKNSCWYIHSGAVYNLP